MTASGPRFCPRCGTGRVGDMGFCPNCGLDLRQLPADERLPEQPASSADEQTFVSPPPEVSPRADATQTADTRDVGRERSTGRSILRPLLAPALLILLVALAATWVLGLGPFGRPGGSGPIGGGGTGAAATPSSPFLPAITPLPSLSFAPGLTAPPVGLTILSPADGAVVGAPAVTVIGTAPPGLRITQDISFGFDRHATADGTGHWAIEAELQAGENQLKFRIGDDPSTAQTIRVVYLAPVIP